MITYLILGITFAFAAGVQPGPLQTYVISQTIKKGWQATLPASFAPIISDGPILILVLLILCNVPNSFILVLRFAGGLFLIYLGIMTFISWHKYNPDEDQLDKVKSKTLMSAVVVNLLNPNPYIGWSLVMGPLFLQGWKETPANGLALIVGFYITIVFTLAGTIVLFGFARKLGPKINKILLGISALALFAFGVYQLWRAIEIIQF